MEAVMAHEFALAIAEAAAQHDLARQRALLAERARAEAGEYPHFVPIHAETEELLFLA